MELLLERIDARLESLALSDNEASKKAGRDRSLIRDLRRRHAEHKPLSVRSDTLDRLASALQTSVPYLLGEVADPSPARSRERPIPLLDAATLLNYQPHERPGSAVIFPTVAVGPQAFAFRVDDDAMYASPGPSLRVGDMIIIDPSVVPLPADAVVAVVEFKVVIRQYRERRDAGGHMFALLAPLNPSYPSFEVQPPIHGAILGVVVEHRRAFSAQSRIEFAS